MRYNITIIITLCITLCAGIITYGWFNNWIIITYHPYRETHNISIPATTETITVCYIPRHYTQEQHESRTIVTTEYQPERAQRILEQWVAALDESYTIELPCHVQAVTESPTQHILYVSFDRMPFNTEDAAYTKWQILETALASLRNNGISAQSVQFLVNHQLAHDYHIDTTFAWPITGFYQRCDTPQQRDHLPTPDRKPLTIALDPAGDVEHAGRTIAGCFERGIALQCCQRLQQRIQELMPHIHVVLTRTAGEPCEPYNNAAFTNRVNADLCISVHAYHAMYTQPHCYVYYYLTHPETDFWHPTHNELTLLPTSHSHIQHVHHSCELAYACGHYLYSTIGSHMSIGPVVGIPYAPLRGMNTPAIALEIGLRTETGWHAYLHQLTTSICNTIMHISKAA